MKGLIGALVALLSLPAAVPAVTLSGVLLYGADSFGNPSVWDPQNLRFSPGQLWHTARGASLGIDWYGLGIIMGVPPDNLEEPPLNLPDFSINVPLNPGDNVFTMAGFPGPLTRGDAFTHFVVNLYFDGVLDHPGISVLFPRFAPRDGDPPTPNNSDAIYSLGVTPVEAAPETSYTDNVDTVTVTAASFLPGEKFGVEYSTVQAYQILPPGVSPQQTNTPGGDPNFDIDYVGVLKINVQGADSGQPIGGVVGPGAFGVQPGTAAVGPDLLGAPGGRAPIVEPVQQQAGAPSASESARNAQQQQIVTGNTPSATEPEPTAGEQTPTPEETVSAVGTRTPLATAAAATPARTPATAAATTHTPEATAQATLSMLTPTPQGSRPVVTPTPHAPKVKARKTR